MANVSGLRKTGQVSMGPVSPRSGKESSFLQFSQTVADVIKQHITQDDISGQKPFDLMHTLENNDDTGEDAKRLSLLKANQCKDMFLHIVQELESPDKWGLSGVKAAPYSSAAEDAVADILVNLLLENDVKQGNDALLEVMTSDQLLSTKTGFKVFKKVLSIISHIGEDLSGVQSREKGETPEGLYRLFPSNGHEGRLFFGAFSNRLQNEHLQLALSKAVTDLSVDPKSFKEIIDNFKSFETKVNPVSAADQGSSLSTGVPAVYGSDAKHATSVANSLATIFGSSMSAVNEHVAKLEDGTYDKNLEEFNTVLFEMAQDPTQFDHFVEAMIAMPFTDPAVRANVERPLVRLMDNLTLQQFSKVSLGSRLQCLQLLTTITSMMHTKVPSPVQDGFPGLDGSGSNSKTMNKMVQVLFKLVGEYPAILDRSQPADALKGLTHSVDAILLTQQLFQCVSQNQDNQTAADYLDKHRMGTTKTRNLVLTALDQMTTSTMGGTTRRFKMKSRPALDNVSEKPRDVQYKKTAAQKTQLERVKSKAVKAQKEAQEHTLKGISRRVHDQDSKSLNAKLVHADITNFSTRMTDLYQDLQNNLTGDRKSLSILQKQEFARELKTLRTDFESCRKVFLKYEQDIKQLSAQSKLPSIFRDSPYSNCLEALDKGSQMLKESLLLLQETPLETFKFSSLFDVSTGKVAADLKGAKGASSVTKLMSTLSEMHEKLSAEEKSLKKKPTKTERESVRLSVVQVVLTYLEQECRVDASGPNKLPAEKTTSDFRSDIRKLESRLLDLLPKNALGEPTMLEYSIETLRKNRTAKSESDHIVTTVFNDLETLRVQLSNVEELVKNNRFHSVKGLTPQQVHLAETNQKRKEATSQFSQTRTDYSHKQALTTDLGSTSGLNDVHAKTRMAVLESCMLNASIVLPSRSSTIPEPLFEAHEVGSLLNTLISSKILNGSIDLDTYDRFLNILHEKVGVQLEAKDHEALNLEKAEELYRPMITTMTDSFMAILSDKFSVTGNTQLHLEKLPDTQLTSKSRVTTLTLNEYVNLLVKQHVLGTVYGDVSKDFNIPDVASATNLIGNLQLLFANPVAFGKGSVTTSENEVLELLKPVFRHPMQSLMLSVPSVERGVVDECTTRFFDKFSARHLSNTERQWVVAEILSAVSQFKHNVSTGKLESTQTAELLKQHISSDLTTLLREKLHEHGDDFLELIIKALRPSTSVQLSKDQEITRYMFTSRANDVNVADQASRIFEKSIEMMQLDAKLVASAGEPKDFSEIVHDQLCSDIHDMLTEFPESLKRELKPLLYTLAIQECIKTSVHCISENAKVPTRLEIELYASVSGLGAGSDPVFTPDFPTMESAIDYSAREVEPHIREALIKMDSMIKSAPAHLEIANSVDPLFTMGKQKFQNRSEVIRSLVLQAEAELEALESELLHLNYSSGIFAGQSSNASIPLIRENLKSVYRELTQNPMGLPKTDLPSENINRQFNAIAKLLQMNKLTVNADEVLKELAKNVKDLRKEFQTHKTDSLHQMRSESQSLAKCKTAEDFKAWGTEQIADVRSDDSTTFFGDLHCFPNQTVGLESLPLWVMYLNFKSADVEENVRDLLVAKEVLLHPENYFKTKSDSRESSVESMKLMMNKCAKDYEIAYKRLHSLLGENVHEARALLSPSAGNDFFNIVATPLTERNSAITMLGTLDDRLPPITGGADRTSSMAYQMRSSYLLTMGVIMQRAYAIAAENNDESGMKMMQENISLLTDKKNGHPSMSATHSADLLKYMESYGPHNMMAPTDSESPAGANTVRVVQNLVTQHCMDISGRTSDTQSHSGLSMIALKKHQFMRLSRDMSKVEQIKLLMTMFRELTSHQNGLIDIMNELDSMGYGTANPTEMSQLMDKVHQVGKDIEDFFKWGFQDFLSTDTTFARNSDVFNNFLQPNNPELLGMTLSDKDVNFLKFLATNFQTLKDAKLFNSNMPSHRRSVLDRAVFQNTFDSSNYDAFNKTYPALDSSIGLKPFTGPSSRRPKAAPQDVHPHLQQPVSESAVPSAPEDMRPYSPPPTYDESNALQAQESSTQEGLDVVDTSLPVESSTETENLQSSESTSPVVEIPEVTGQSIEEILPDNISRAEMKSELSDRSLKDLKNNVMDIVNAVSIQSDLADLSSSLQHVNNKEFIEDLLLTLRYDGEDRRDLRALGSEEANGTLRKVLDDELSRFVSTNPTAEVSDTQLVTVTSKHVYDSTYISRSVQKCLNDLQPVSFKGDIESQLVPLEAAVTEFLQDVTPAKVDELNQVLSDSANIDKSKAFILGLAKLYLLGDRKLDSFAKTLDGITNSQQLTKFADLILKDGSELRVPEKVTDEHHFCTSYKYAEGESYSESDIPNMIDFRRDLTTFRLNQGDSRLKALTYQFQFATVSDSVRHQLIHLGQTDASANAVEILQDQIKSNAEVPDLIQSIQSDQLGFDGLRHAVECFAKELGETVDRGPEHNKDFKDFVEQLNLLPETESKFVTSLAFAITLEFSGGDGLYNHLIVVRGEQDWRAEHQILFNNLENTHADCVEALGEDYVGKPTLDTLKIYLFGRNNSRMPNLDAVHDPVETSLPEGLSSEQFEQILPEVERLDESLAPLAVDDKDFDSSGQGGRLVDWSAKYQSQPEVLSDVNNIIEQAIKDANLPIVTTDGEPTAEHLNALAQALTDAQNELSSGNTVTSVDQPVSNPEEVSKALGEIVNVLGETAARLNGVSNETGTETTSLDDSLKNVSTDLKLLGVDADLNELKKELKESCTPEEIKALESKTRQAVQSVAQVGTQSESDRLDQTNKEIDNILGDLSSKTPKLKEALKTAVVKNDEKIVEIKERQELAGFLKDTLELKDADFSPLTVDSFVNQFNVEENYSLKDVLSEVLPEFAKITASTKPFSQLTLDEQLALSQDVLDLVGQLGTDANLYFNPLEKALEARIKRLNFAKANGEKTPADKTKLLAEQVTDLNLPEDLSTRSTGVIQNTPDGDLDEFLDIMAGLLSAEDDDDMSSAEPSNSTPLANLAQAVHSVAPDLSSQLSELNDAREAAKAAIQNELSLTESDFVTVNPDQGIKQWVESFPNSDGLNTVTAVVMTSVQTVSEDPAFDTKLHRYHLTNQSLEELKDKESELTEPVTNLQKVINTKLNDLVQKSQNDTVSNFSTLGIQSNSDGTAGSIEESISALTPLELNRLAVVSKAGAESVSASQTESDMKQFDVKENALKNIAEEIEQSSLAGTPVQEAVTNALTQLNKDREFKQLQLNAKDTLTQQVGLDEDQTNLVEKYTSQEPLENLIKTVSEGIGTDVRPFNELSDPDKLNRLHKVESEFNGIDPNEVTAEIQGIISSNKNAVESSIKDSTKLLLAHAGLQHDLSPDAVSEDVAEIIDQLPTDVTISMANAQSIITPDTDEASLSSNPKIAEMQKQKHLLDQVNEHIVPQVPELKGSVETKQAELTETIRHELALDKLKKDLSFLDDDSKTKFEEACILFKSADDVENFAKKLFESSNEIVLGSNPTDEEQVAVFGAILQGKAGASAINPQAAEAVVNFAQKKYDDALQKVKDNVVQKADISGITEVEGEDFNKFLDSLSPEEISQLSSSLNQQDFETTPIGTTGNTTESAQLDRDERNINNFEKACKSIDKLNPAIALRKAEIAEKKALLELKNKVSLMMRESLGLDDEAFSPKTLREWLDLFNDVPNLEHIPNVFASIIDGQPSFSDLKPTDQVTRLKTCKDKLKTYGGRDNISHQARQLDTAIQHKLNSLQLAVKQAEVANESDNKGYTVDLDNVKQMDEATADAVSEALKNAPALSTLASSPDQPMSDASLDALKRMAIKNKSIGSDLSAEQRKSLGVAESIESKRQFQNTINEVQSQIAKQCENSLKEAPATKQAFDDVYAFFMKECLSSDAPFTALHAKSLEYLYNPIHTIADYMASQLKESNSGGSVDRLSDRKLQFLYNALLVPRENTDESALQREFKSRIQGILTKGVYGNAMTTTHEGQVKVHPAFTLEQVQTDDTALSNLVTRMCDPTMLREYKNVPSLMGFGDDDDSGVDRFGVSLKSVEKPLFEQIRDGNVNSVKAQPYLLKQVSGMIAAAILDNKVCEGPDEPGSFPDPRYKGHQESSVFRELRNNIAARLERQLSKNGTPGSAYTDLYMLQGFFRERGLDEYASSAQADRGKINQENSVKRIIRDVCMDLAPPGLKLSCSEHVFDGTLQDLNPCHIRGDLKARVLNARDAAVGMKGSRLEMVKDLRANLNNIVKVLTGQDNFICVDPTKDDDSGIMDNEAFKEVVLYRGRFPELLQSYVGQCKNQDNQDLLSTFVDTVYCLRGLECRSEKFKDFSLPEGWSSLLKEARSAIKPPRTDIPRTQLLRLLQNRSIATEKQMGWVRDFFSFTKEQDARCVQSKVIAEGAGGGKTVIMNLVLDFMSRGLKMDLPIHIVLGGPFTPEKDAFVGMEDKVEVQQILEFLTVDDSGSVVKVRDFINSGKSFDDLTRIMIPVKHKPITECRLVMDEFHKFGPDADIYFVDQDLYLDEVTVDDKTFLELKPDKDRKFDMSPTDKRLEVSGYFKMSATPSESVYAIESAAIKQYNNPEYVGQYLNELDEKLEVVTKELETAKEKSRGQFDSFVEFKSQGKFNVPVSGTRTLLVGMWQPGEVTVYKNFVNYIYGNDDKEAAKELTSDLGVQTIKLLLCKSNGRDASKKLIPPKSLINKEQVVVSYLKAAVLAGSAEELAQGPLGQVMEPEHLQLFYKHKFKLAKVMFNWCQGWNFKDEYLSNNPLSKKVGREFIEGKSFKVVSKEFGQVFQNIFNEPLPMANEVMPNWESIYDVLVQSNDHQLERLESVVGDAFEMVTYLRILAQIETNNASGTKKLNVHHIVEHGVDKRFEHYTPEFKVLQEQRLKLEAKMEKYIHGSKGVDQESELRLVPLQTGESVNDGELHVDYKGTSYRVNDGKGTAWSRPKFEYDKRVVLKERYFSKVAQDHDVVSVSQSTYSEEADIFENYEQGLKETSLIKDGDIASGQLPDRVFMSSSKIYSTGASFEKGMQKLVAAAQERMKTAEHGVNVVVLLKDTRPQSSGYGKLLCYDPSVKEPDGPWYYFRAEPESQGNEVEKKEYIRYKKLVSAVAAEGKTLPIILHDTTTFQGSDMGELTNTKDSYSQLVEGQPVNRKSLHLAFGEEDLTSAYQRFYRDRILRDLGNDPFNEQNQSRVPNIEFWFSSSMDPNKRPQSPADVFGYMKTREHERTARVGIKECRNRARNYLRDYLQRTSDKSKLTNEEITEALKNVTAKFSEMRTSLVNDASLPVTYKGTPCEIIFSTLSQSKTADQSDPGKFKTFVTLQSFLDAVCHELGPDYSISLGREQDLALSFGNNYRARQTLNYKLQQAFNALMRSQQYLLEHAENSDVPAVELLNHEVDDSKKIEVKVPKADPVDMTGFEIKQGKTKAWTRAAAEDPFLKNMEFIQDRTYESKGLTFGVSVPSYNDTLPKVHTMLKDWKVGKPFPPNFATSEYGTINAGKSVNDFNFNKRVPLTHSKDFLEKFEQTLPGDLVTEFKSQMEATPRKITRKGAQGPHNLYALMISMISGQAFASIPALASDLSSDTPMAGDLVPATQYLAMKAVGVTVDVSQPPLDLLDPETISLLDAFYDRWEKGSICTSGKSGVPVKGHANPNSSGGNALFSGSPMSDSRTFSDSSSQVRQSTQNQTRPSWFRQDGDDSLPKSVGDSLATQPKKSSLKKPGSPTHKRRTSFSELVAVGETDLDPTGRIGDQTDSEFLAGQDDADKYKGQHFSDEYKGSRVRLDDVGLRLQDEPKIQLNVTTDEGYGSETSSLGSTSSLSDFKEESVPSSRGRLKAGMIQDGDELSPGYIFPDESEYSQMGNVSRLKNIFSGTQQTDLKPRKRPGQLRPDVGPVEGTVN